MRLSSSAHDFVSWPIVRTSRWLWPRPRATYVNQARISERMARCGAQGLKFVEQSLELRVYIYIYIQYIHILYINICIFIYNWKYTYVSSKTLSPRPPSQPACTKWGYEVQHSAALRPLLQFLWRPFCSTFLCYRAVRTRPLTTTRIAISPGLGSHHRNSARPCQFTLWDLLTCSMQQAGVPRTETSTLLTADTGKYGP